MSLLIAALIGLLTWALWREPGGRLWRVLVETPARKLSRITWRHVTVAILALILAQLLVEVAVPQLALVLAVDIVGWIDVLIATVVAARLLPSWRAMKGQTGRMIQRMARPRAQRARRIRRPTGKPSDDPDPVGVLLGGLAFA